MVEYDWIWLNMIEYGWIWLNWITIRLKFPIKKDFCGVNFEIKAYQIFKAIILNRRLIDDWWLMIELNGQG